MSSLKMGTVVTGRVTRTMQGINVELVFRATAIRILLPGGNCRNLEVYATIVVGFAGSRKIEVSEKYPFCAARREVKERVSHDGIVEHVRLVTILENKNGRELSRHGPLHPGVHNRSRGAVYAVLRGMSRDNKLAVVSVEFVLVSFRIFSFRFRFSSVGNIGRF